MKTAEVSKMERRTGAYLQYFSPTGRLSFITESLDSPKKKKKFDCSSTHFNHEVQKKKGWVILLNAIKQ